MEPCRRTLGDTDTFVIPQFWEARDHVVWWDLRYLHLWLKKSCCEQYKLQKWFKDKFTRLAARETGLPLRAPPEGVGQCVADTFALVAFLWNSAGLFDKAMRDACVARVRAMTSKVTVELAPEHASMTLEGITCRVHNGGQMSGFLALCGGHATTGKLLAAAWARMHDEGFLNTPGDTDLHCVADVATFFMLILRMRRDSKLRISRALRRLVDGVSRRMMEWLAGAVDAYVLKVYSADNSLTGHAPPALVNTARGPLKRKYVVVSAEAAWDVMEKAHHARANLEQAIRLKDDEASLGCHYSQAERWAQKKNQMYCERTSAVFTHIYHWNLVADPGTHTYKEVMPAVLYSWEIDMGCLPQFQFILPSKGGVTDYDCQLEDDLETLAQERKLERVATYRQLQGP